MLIKSKSEGSQISGLVMSTLGFTSTQYTGPQFVFGYTTFYTVYSTVLQVNVDYIICLLQKLDI